MWGRKSVVYRDVNTHFEYAHNYEYFYIVTPNAAVVQTILRRCGKMQRKYVCGTNEAFRMVHISSSYDNSYIFFRNNR